MGKATTSSPLNSLGSQFGTTVASSTALTIPSGTNPAHMIININTQAVRWTTDGTAPTATKGIHVAVGGQISFMDPNFDYTPVIRAIRIIEEVSAATIDVLYFD